MTTFLVPFFNKTEQGKVNNTIDVPSPHVLVKTTTSKGCTPAISSQGFPANRDGTYVFVTLAEKTVGNVAIRFGFTSTQTVDSTSQGAYPGYGMQGVYYLIRQGDIGGGTGNLCALEQHILDFEHQSENWYHGYFHSEGRVALDAKEIISILTISTKGSKRFGFTQKRHFQVIVDGHESDVQELRDADFGNGGEIFPMVTLREKKQKLEFISFDQVESTSPRIGELMKEFLSAKMNKDKEEQEESQKKAQLKKAPKKKADSSKTTVAKKKDAKENAPTKKKTAKKATTPTKKTGKKVDKK